jgi:uncharacterized protein (DUF58 family)
VLTPRFLIFALVFPALLLVAVWVPTLALIAWIYALGLAVLLGLDWRRAGPVTQFEIRRSHHNRLSLGAANRIVIEVQSRARRSLTLIVRDEPPYQFAGTEQATQSAALPPQGTAEMVYTLRPLRRGDYAFGDLNLRWSSPLGFYIRQAVIPAAVPVKVYPNLHDIRKFELLARRDQLAEVGLRNVRLRGEGTMFESLREYMPDDPYRSINWKATARRAKPISMDYEPERNSRVVIALDVGRMMRSPIHVEEQDGVFWQMAKVDFVINSVLLFSYVAALKGDQVGLLVFADRVQFFLPPQSGRAHFQNILESMYALESQPVEPDYGRMFTFLSAHSKKRALTVVFTDLSGLRASEALARYMPRLAPRHVPLLVTIRDPAFEYEAQQVPTTSERVYRRAVAGQLVAERRLLLEKLRRQGVFTLDVSAENLSMAVVSRYLELKAKQYV